MKEEFPLPVGVRGDGHDHPHQRGVLSGWQQQRQVEVLNWQHTLRTQRALSQSKGNATLIVIINIVLIVVSTYLSFNKILVVAAMFGRSGYVWS